MTFSFIDMICKSAVPVGILLRVQRISAGARTRRTITSQSNNSPAIIPIKSLYLIYFSYNLTV